tara:strand:+ start:2012 stop:2476 length:465 start_codon:yes stop_codon:yes gene_type:complete
MAIENATNVVIRVADDENGTNTQTLAFSTSASLSMTTDLRDSTTKSSGGFQENLAGLKSYELSGDGFVDLSANTVTGTDPFGGSSGPLKAVQKLWDLWVGGTKVQVVFGTGSAGSSAKTYSGDAFISSLSFEGGVEENATYSITLTGTGALTES